MEKPEEPKEINANNIPDKIMEEVQVIPGGIEETVESTASEEEIDKEAKAFAEKLIKDLGEDPDIEVESAEELEAAGKM